MSTLIGVISDTHGVVRPEALSYFGGADLIFHGGDIGSVAVLRALERIAPVVAVRGNCDREEWSKELPISRSFEIEGRRFLIVHNRRDLKVPPRDFDGVIFGHSQGGSGCRYRWPGLGLKTGNCCRRLLSWFRL